MTRRSHLPIERILLPHVIEHEYEIGELTAMGAKSKEKLLGFDVADPSIETPAHIKQAMVKALERKDATHYTRIRGLPAFVESVAEFYSRRFGVEVDPMDNVLATVGSCEALFVIFLATVSPGDEFIIPNPTFPQYGSLMHLFGGVARFVPTKPDFHLDLGTIEAAVTPRTKAIVLCTPNNPTGAVYTRQELAKVLKLAKEKQLLVISDENYSLVTYDGRSHCTIASLPGAMERVVVVNGLSKVFAMTGWRLGYLIARKDIVEQAEKVAYEMHGSVNTAVQYAGAAALRTSDRRIAQIVKQYDRKRKLTVSGLREAGFTCHMPEGGFEALAEVPAGFGGSTSFAEYLVEKAAVLVKPGHFFGPEGERFFRMVYCRDEKVIKQGLKRIAKAMRA
jgi:aminotransferase